MDHRGVSRRRVLRLGVAALAGLLAPVGRAAAADARTLALRSLHTGEFVRATYWAAGRYVRDGLIEIDRLLRDHRSNTVHPIDRRLLDVLGALRERLETREPFEVISGYRSPATNARLVATTGGVASRSLHMEGMAVDLRVPGRPLAAVRDAAKALGAGGVGYYPDSDFVHVDVGRIRYW
ncbi:MAG TPA: DUF882 domain-containing protein [Methylomirabilota bacterium]|jgi:uncharacterized protein YcbK (DUF882 family)|nr:DUF882 domain-containing protein [Methylomirabilota bacterium]